MAAKLDVLLANAAEGGGIEMAATVRTLVLSVIYVGLGLIVFMIAFFLMTKIAPFSVRKEIEEDQNTALGIVMGSVIIGVAIIIAAAISG